MNPRPVRAFLLASLVALAFAAIGATGASASPTWRLGGTQLTGTETIAGEALASSFTIPSLTTECELTYKMSISNVAGVGKAEITALSLKNCTTISEACPVETAAAEKLPWPLHLTAIGSKIYVVLEKVRISFLYGGEECALGEVLTTITGSAGASFDNTNSTMTFNPSNFTATGTELKALGSKIDWNCILTTEATGAHSGQPLQVG